MKLFINYLRCFLKEDFQVKYYLSVAVFLAITIAVNYNINFEDGILDQINGYFPRAAAFFSFYLSLYISVLGISKIFYPEIPIKNSKFWITMCFGILVLSIDVAVQPSEILSGISPETRYFIGKMLSNVGSLITTLIPLWLFFKLLDHEQPSFYGLTASGFIPQAYMQLFLIVIPIVIIGSFLPGFAQQYPMYKSSSAHLFWGIPEWINIVSYELAYGWNFLSIELLFRGFFVFAMMKFLGRHAILPMAVVYCSIHFGKPMGECISSVFGGYILGVIAFYSKNIWGGVIVHIGLAWSMEVVSAIQKITG